MPKESTIIVYNSSTQGSVPSGASLVSGEVAINVADEKVFFKNSAGNVLPLSQTKDISGAYAKIGDVVNSHNGLTGDVTMTGDSGAVIGRENDKMTARIATLWDECLQTGVTGVAMFYCRDFVVDADGLVRLAAFSQCDNTNCPSGDCGQYDNLSDCQNAGCQWSCALQDCSCVSPPPWARTYTGIGASGASDGSLSYIYLDIGGLSSVNASTIDNDSDLILFYDTSETAIVKTKKASISKLLVDSYSTFESKGNQLTITKGSNRIEFTPVLGAISAADQGLVKGASAFSYLELNTVKSINGRTGNYAIPVATTGLSGVASFNSSHFSVSGTGHVSLASGVTSGAKGPEYSLQFNVGGGFSGNANINVDFTNDVASLTISGDNSGLRLYNDGKVIVEGQGNRTMHVQHSSGEGIYLGSDAGTYILVEEQASSVTINAPTSTLIESLSVTISGTANVGAVLSKNVVNSYGGMTGDIVPLVDFAEMTPRDAGGTSQFDLIAFTDFLDGQFVNGASTSSIFAANAGGGGSYVSNNVTDLAAYTNSVGIIRMTTGTSNNNTGYSAVQTGSFTRGLTATSSSYVNKYQWEGSIRLDSTIFNVAGARYGYVRLGMIDTFNSTAPGDGVYFEFSVDGITNDSTWKMVIRNGTNFTRHETGMTASASKVYRMRGVASRNSQGNFGIDYYLRNVTDSFSMTGTAVPSKNGDIPNGVQDNMGVGVIIGKSATATTSSTQILADYIGARFQFPQNREITLFE